MATRTCPRCGGHNVGHLTELLEYLLECETVYQPPKNSSDPWAATTIAFEP